MAKSKGIVNQEQVTAYYEQLNHPLLPTIQALRHIVLSTSTEIAEQIKWNSPSFYYTGNMKPFDPKEYKRDLVVFNLHKQSYILLVFPTGEIINDTSDLLEGNFSDGRKTIKFSSVKEVENRKNDLQSVIKAWLQLTAC